MSEHASSAPILVIRHGALGDFILSTGPMKAIRAAHPAARIVLLTTEPYAAFARATGWFDEVWVDERAPWKQLHKIMALAEKLRSLSFARVYDLQTSTRSSAYWWAFLGRTPAWSGIAALASHRHANPERTRMHTLDRQREQLGIAGITEVPEPDVSWLTGDISAFSLPSSYTLLVPGCSPHRLMKRWPKKHFSDFAGWLINQNITPVLIGTKHERDLLDAIAAACPKAINLCDRTSLGQIAELARHATGAVGVDTGPMHIIAETGCKTLLLFSEASDPAKCGPRGPHVRVLRRDDLATLTPEEVAEAAKTHLFS
ncbi:MAG: glycosyltransferase family 9 protein [Alphaproteobacteria bacterium]|nr:glycosyltransferase family 9 protein [Alphaproteobacteria bacterium]